MKVLTVRNVHQTLPQALRLLHEIGIPRPSRNGPVLQSPEPIATVYTNPCERVMFWPERDANPFFHLYESLWMLAGRNDLAGPQRYVKDFGKFSDDQKTLWGAYGYRWRNTFRLFQTATAEEKILNYNTWDGQYDQLKIISESLKKNPTDRRCVLQMWNAELDLGRDGADLPCNDTATFQISPEGKLDLVVFCRSNDIVWGAYGANAVHFSYLLEYMAVWIGVPVGTYTQISVNWHGYLNTLDKVDSIKTVYTRACPYTDAPLVQYIPMRGHIEAIDENIHSILHEADTGFKRGRSYSDPWAQMVYTMLQAHHLYTKNKTDMRMLPKQQSLELLEDYKFCDWGLAGIQWLERRKL